MWGMKHKFSIFKFQFSSSRRGFTLVELIVVLGITVLLASFAIVYSRQSGTQIALYIEAQKMAELVFRAKSLALTAYRDPSLGNICGFGFAIDYTKSPSEYFLFSYRSSGGCGGIVDIDTTRIDTFLGERYALNPGLVLQSSGSPLYYVLFIPPNPTTIVSNSADGSHSTIGRGDIVLRAVNGAGMTITISSGGQINF